MDVGAQLRVSREAAGLSLEQVAAHTRVHPRILAAIERNDIRALPPRPYGRGFVHAYAEEVGLDPDETVRQYFARFAPAVPEATGEAVAARAAPEPSPAWIWLGGTATALVLLVAWSVGSNSAQEDSAPPPVGTSGNGSAVAVGTSSTPPDSPAARGAQPEHVAAASQPVTVLLTATRDCWVTATADGERAIYRLLRAGDRETLRGEREVVVRAGDAGALLLTINGRDTGLFGSPGEVRTQQFTPAETRRPR